MGDKVQVTRRKGKMTQAKVGKRGRVKMADVQVLVPAVTFSH
jgi:hypothetical protein